MTTTSGLYWPIGRVADRLLLVIGAETADMLALILDGEPEPEDGDAYITIVPAAIPSLRYPCAKLAEELREGPGDVQLVFSRSEAAYAFYNELAKAMVDIGLIQPDTAFLPAGVQLKDVLDRLPAGEVATAPGSQSRVRLFKEVLMALWFADASDEELAPIILRQAAGR